MFLEWCVNCGVNHENFTLFIKQSIMKADHMIMPTSLITISLRTLKNSSISLAFSPIFPMQIPNATKNPMRPTETHIATMLIWRTSITASCIYCDQNHLLPKTFMPLLNWRDFLITYFAAPLVTFRPNRFGFGGGATSILLVTVWIYIKRYKNC